MIRLAKGQLRLSIFALLCTAPCASAPLPGETDAACDLKGAVFQLDFGWTKAPTKAAVILPDGKLLRLRDPSDGIDTLGSDYATGRLRLNAASLVGMNHYMRSTRVFNAPGKYEFLFLDANTAEGMDLHRLHCTVTLSDAEAHKLREQAAR